jgi:hypothetical protein
MGLSESRPAEYVGMLVRPSGRRPGVATRPLAVKCEPIEEGGRGA